MYSRLQKFLLLDKETCFLWGPRQTGKSTLLKALYPDAPYYDLLRAEEFARLTRHPSLLQEEILAKPLDGPVIIDEVQKIPFLLDEIQWLMVNKNIQFVLCGSSARKLKREGANLLGGRAVRYELFPLVSSEIPNFDLLKALNHGLLPRHYLSNQPKKLLEAYVGDYLKEEIAHEALTRNIPTFFRFLEASCFSNGEIVNYLNIARECGVSSPTVKEYFQILSDTLIGRFLFCYRKKAKRRVILAPKFYFFDVGIVNYLLKRTLIVPGSEMFGKALEQFIFQELIAYSHYSGKDFPLYYWRTTSGLEVDFVLGDADSAIEVKGVLEVQSHHLHGMKAFIDEQKVKSPFIVSLDKKPRLIGKIQVLPVGDFLEKLWHGEIL